MEWSVFLCVVCVLLSVAVCVLFFWNYLLKKSAREIRAQLTEFLDGDTNMRIAVSTFDPDMRALANDLNRELSKLRTQKHRYVSGDKEIREAVTNISHDLRTPLTAIIAYLELLEREEKSPSVQEYLELIRNRTMAMKGLSEELFRYSVVLSGEEEFVLEKVSLNGVLEEAIAGMYGAFTKRGITPEISMPEHTVYGIADRGALLRVVGNVLDNALKYSVGDLGIVLSEDGRMQFSNSAKQLSNVDVGRLFDRFYTVDSARRSTGLGLAIAKYLSERMGAEIAAAYEGGKLVITLQVRSEGMGEWGIGEWLVQKKIMETK